MPSPLTYTESLDGIDWEALKADLAADRFDNGRSPEQLRRSFENSCAVVLACRGERVIGTARVLSDGVCNAYVVDVWTQSEFRRQEIGRQMMEILLSRLEGQHVYLFTDDATGFYRKLGFEEQPTGLGRVVGTWLQTPPQEFG